MLYLHIGTDKTGSTAIQKFLHWNRTRFAAYGFFYPSAGLMHYDHGRLKIAVEECNREPWDELRQEVAAAACEHVIVSNEGFYHLRGEQLDRLIDWLPASDVRVIIYLRRQDEMIESGMLQQLKTCEVVPQIEDLEAGEMPWLPHLDYSELVNRWCAAFGRERVVVRPYGRKFLPSSNDIYCDFLHAIGCDTSILQGLSLPQKDPNPSLDAASALALAFLHRLGLAREQHDTVTDLLLHFQRVHGRSAGRLFSREQRLAILARYEDSNNKLSMLPAELFQIPDQSFPAVGQKEVENRISFVYDNRRYLIGCREWYGEPGFAHLVREGYIRLLQGFYPVENWGGWMNGRERSRLAFRVPRTFQARLALTLNVQYLCGASSLTRVRADSGEWTALESTTTLVISPNCYEQHMGLVFLEFEHEGADSPASQGLSPLDQRLLGAGITSMRFTELPNATVSS